MHGPSRRSLAGKLVQAILSIEAGRYDFADDLHVETDLEELDLDDSEAYVDLIYECLKIALNEPVKSYRPPIDPISTRHVRSQGMQMYAFLVKHQAYTEHIYLKFCLDDQQDGTWYVHIDCHPSHKKPSP